MAGRLWGDLVPMLRDAVSGGGYLMSRSQSFLLGSGSAWMVQQGAAGALGDDVAALFDAYRGVASSIVDESTAAEMLRSFEAIKSDCIALDEDQSGWG